MSTARVLIKQGKKIFRFLRLETSSDGSLNVILDRDFRANPKETITNEDKAFIPDQGTSERRRLSARFSVHTTGEVHCHSMGKRVRTIYIEPLYSVNRVHEIGSISIPRVSLLGPVSV